jgi:glucosamine-6-phosphate deaminase
MSFSHFQSAHLRCEIHTSRQAAGAAAAAAAAEVLRQQASANALLGVIFATGASQLATLSSLTSTPGLPWRRICGFHLDEYIDLSPHHPASFRRYLREHLTQLVPLGEFHEIDGNTSDPDRMRSEYLARLRASDPQLCLLGIGENGHIAFNDPGEADFDDAQGMKAVELDLICRQQQLAEGWFETLDEVPSRAFTLTIPTVLKVPKLIVSVPGYRKAQVVRRMLTDPISTACPATILRTHPDVTVYLDQDSASELDGSLVSHGGDNHVNISVR